MLFTNYNRSFNIEVLLFNVSRSEDANKAFSQAVQMHDSLVKAWALWGDYLDNLFTRERYLHFHGTVCLH